MTRKEALFLDGFCHIEGWKKCLGCAIEYLDRYSYCTNCSKYVCIMMGRILVELHMFEDGKFEEDPTVCVFYGEQVEVIMVCNVKFW